MQRPARPTEGHETISVVIPVRNEEENVLPLHRELVSTMSAHRLSFEVIFVDDHSSDQTGMVLHALASRDMLVRVLRLQAESGKDAALVKGMSAATGTIIVTMDGDLENDPADIVRLLEALQDADMVCGVRASRKDSWQRQAVSRVANWTRNVLTSDRTTDAGCSLRAFRRQWVASLCAANLPRNQAHCFFPLFIRMAGGKVVEIPVNDRPRVAGRTKFGLVRGRMLSGIRACLAVRRFQRRNARSNAQETGSGDMGRVSVTTST